MQYIATHYNTLQHTANKCNTLQHTATHCNTLQQHTSATHCNTLQHTATHCNTLQHNATYCNKHLWIAPKNHTCPRPRTHCPSQLTEVLKHKLATWSTIQNDHEAEIWENLHQKSARYPIFYVEWKLGWLWKFSISPRAFTNGRNSQKSIQ